MRDQCLWQFDGARLARCLGLDEMEPLCSDLRITKLFVRTALAGFGETELDENGDDFIGLENGNITHSLSDCDVLNPNKLGL